MKPGRAPSAAPWAEMPPPAERPPGIGRGGGGEREEEEKEVAM